VSRAEDTYLIGFDEETVYLRRSEYPTLAEATARFRALVLDEFGYPEDEIADIRGVAIEAPEHVNDDSACYHSTCDCPPVPLWEFAP
jgi:hypothetical protein